MQKTLERDQLLHDFPYIDHIPSVWLPIVRQSRDIYEENVTWAFIVSLIMGGPVAKLRYSNYMMSTRTYFRQGLLNSLFLVPTTLIWTWAVNPFC